jgi:MYXO-CTERM domain-containing protein
VNNGCVNNAVDAGGGTDSGSGGTDSGSGGTDSGSGGTDSGSGGTDSGSGGTDSGSGGTDSGGGSDACTPSACGLGQCGMVSNGCGANMDCGGCTGGGSCVNNQCVPAGVDASVPPPPHDAGVHHDAGGANLDGSADAADTSTGDNSGCGCRTAGASTSTGALPLGGLAGLALLGLVRFRRRRAA